MCFNTFNRFIHQEKYKQFGFSAYDTLDCLFKPVHWLQFADDAAVVTRNERENHLLNCSTKWCQWSIMVMRVDKCVTFGTNTFLSRSLQPSSVTFGLSYQSGLPQRVRDLHLLLSCVSVSLAPNFLMSSLMLSMYRL